jgi:hypothetical protein
MKLSVPSTSSMFRSSARAHTQALGEETKKVIEVGEQPLSVVKRWVIGFAGLDDETIRSYPLYRSYTMIGSCFWHVLLL